MPDKPPAVTDETLKLLRTIIRIERTRANIALRHDDTSSAELITAGADAIEAVLDERGKDKLLIERLMESINVGTARRRTIRDERTKLKADVRRLRTDLSLCLHALTGPGTTNVDKWETWKRTVELASQDTLAATGPDASASETGKGEG